MLKHIKEQPDDNLSPSEPNGTFSTTTNPGPVKRWPVATQFQRRLAKVRRERLEALEAECEISTSVIALVALLLLSGCTSPLWWHQPQYVTIYKGTPIFLTSQATVATQCENPIALGCTQVYNYRFGTTDRVIAQRPRFAFSVDNPVVLAHECAHIDALKAGGSIGGEQLKDLLGLMFPFEYLLTGLTAFFPAAKDKPCGEAGTMADFKDGKWTIYQRQYQDSAILPTPEEVGRGIPIPFKK